MKDNPRIECGCEPMSIRVPKLGRAREMKTKQCLWLLTLASINAAIAAPPTFQTDTCPVRVDGAIIGTQLTPQGASLRNTIAYEPTSGLYHFWGFLADDTNFPSSASALGAVKHASSNDGVHFTSDAYLSYGIGSADYHNFGADIDPPLDFFRAVYDTDTGTWKLFNWTENDQIASPSFGQYNYNTSVNDLGSVADNTSVVHQGPLNSLYAGNHVGTFGLVSGNIYLRLDGGPSDGGDAQLPYTDGIPPSAAAKTIEADLFTGTPYCWELAADSSGVGPPVCSNPILKPAYVHNVGRTLLQTDGTLSTYYDFRVCTSQGCGNSVRADKQIWYVESNDNGVTWSAPTGVFADGSVLTIDHQALDADPGTANFSNVDVVDVPAAERLYFSTQNSAGDYVFVSAKSIASDTIFADGFEGCD